MPKFRLLLLAAEKPGTRRPGRCKGRLTGDHIFGHKIDSRFVEKVGHDVEVGRALPVGVSEVRFPVSQRLDVGQRRDVVAFVAGKVFVAVVEVEFFNLVDLEPTTRGQRPLGGLPAFRIVEACQEITTCSSAIAIKES